jgi:hypothetical protein
MKLTETSLRKIIKDVILENQDDLVAQEAENNVKDFIDICKKNHLSDIGNLENVTQIKYLVDLLSKHKSTLKFGKKDSKTIRLMAQTITDKLITKHNAGQYLIDELLQLYLVR